MMEYTHTNLDEEVKCIAGYYAPSKEVKIRYKDKDVLYITGNVNIESSCCGTGNWCYITVPGYITRWHNKTNENGLPISEIEPVTDRTEQLAIEKIIMENESINADARPINFW